MEVGVTMLGDTQKLEMQLQVCLDAYLMVSDISTVKGSQDPGLPIWRPRHPLTQVQGTPKKPRAFVVLKVSGKCLKAEGRLLLVHA